jgi:hypothetical protein
MAILGDADAEGFERSENTFQHLVRSDLVLDLFPGEFTVAKNLSQ